MVLLSSANEAASCLVALVNKTSDSNYSFLTLEEMSTYMKDQVAEQKKDNAGNTSEEDVSSD
jgi:hypothetical protein